MTEDCPQQSLPASALRCMYMQVCMCVLILCSDITCYEMTAGTSENLRSPLVIQHLHTYRPNSDQLAWLCQSVPASNHTACMQ